MEPIIPQLIPFIRLKVEVAPPISLDKTSNGERKLIPIVGGEVTGKLTGKITNGGSDAIFIRSDGCAELNARYCLVLDGGEALYVEDKGYRHGPPNIMKQLAQGELVNPSEYYFRTCMKIETGADNLQWLNQSLFIGSGCRHPDHVLIDLFQLT